MIGYNFQAEQAQIFDYCVWEEKVVNSASYIAEQMQFNSISDADLNAVLNTFCFGDCMATIDEKKETEIKPLNVPEWKRTKKTLLLQTINFSKLTERLLHELNLIQRFSDEVVIGKSKSNRNANRSFRRSLFIGVSKNGPNWQALISINKRKTYIGTYRSEAQAARAFDFYSLLLHSTTAKTNFDYTKSDILAMIEKFQESEGNIDSIMF